MSIVEVVLPAPLQRPHSRGPFVQHVWKSLPERPVLGLLDNGKGRADELLLAIGRHLERQGAVAGHFIWRKPSAGKPITSDERDALLSRADVVIAGVGDCGSCSSCSFHDAASCSEAGTPAAVVITRPFEWLVEATAKNLDAPGVPIVAVAHPIWTRDAEWFQRTAEQACESLMKRLFNAKENAQ